MSLKNDGRHDVELRDELQVHKHMASLPNEVAHHVCIFMKYNFSYFTNLKINMSCDCFVQQLLNLMY